MATLRQSIELVEFLDDGILRAGDFRSGATSAFTHVKEKGKSRMKRKLPAVFTAALAVATFFSSAHASIVAQVGAATFGSVTHLETFDGGDFGSDPDYFFPADRYNVTSASGFLFRYSSTVAQPGFVVWPGDAQVGFDTRSLYQDAGADAMATISLAGGGDIELLQLDVANGWGPVNPQNVWVRAYNNGVATGFDYSFLIATPKTLSIWSNGTVFDEIRIAAYSAPISGSETQYSAVSFDNVKVGTLAQGVPEPGTLALLGLGVTGLVVSRKRKQ